MEMALSELIIRDLNGLWPELPCNRRYSNEPDVDHEMLAAPKDKITQLHLRLRFPCRYSFM